MPRRSGPADRPEPDEAPDLSTDQLAVRLVLSGVRDPVILGPLARPWVDHPSETP